MVLATQQWLNKTYTGRAGYNSVEETGNTGWPTIYALTRALQIELGITATADSFGPTTKRLFSERFPNGVQQQPDGAEQEDNIYAIIQGTLWCKGYSTGAGYITKHFYDGTGNAIKSLKEDAGLLVPDSTVTLNVMIALLSMNQYVTLYLRGGTDVIRYIQQRLNRKYENYIGLAPCDGLYGREMNRALIIVLQAIEGLSVSQATGNFGDKTKALCPMLPDTQNVLPAQKEADAIDLLKYALICNGYSITLLTSTWDTTLEDTIRSFQSDMLLLVNGKADLNTWMSLLLSKGNPDRAATACDTRFEMTTERIEQLKNNGYQIVGRYLTGTEYKVLRTDEPKRILNNGLFFFPIFQESGSDITYFNADRGIVDAQKAVRAARNFGIPEGTVIYYAVDLDAQNWQITDYILPYFDALSTNMDTAYKIGVYGTRNVCTKVNDAGFAVTSFVSDMSTGYSGNMGFKMPANWTFDQFAEIPMVPDWAIDKDSYSGAFPPVTILNTEVYQKPQKPSVEGLPSILTVMDKIHEVEQLYISYYDGLMQPPDDGIPTLNTSLLANGITNFLRSERYYQGEWTATTMSPIDTAFVEYVKSNNMDLFNYLYPYIKEHDNELLTDGGDGLIDLAHIAATMECYIMATLVPDFWAGWGGDLATAMADTTEASKVNPNESLQNLADSIVGNVNFQFNYSDMCIDADAIKIAAMVRGSTSALFSEVLNTYYTTNSLLKNRYSYYVDDIGCKPNLTALKERIYAKMTGLLEKDTGIGLLHLKGKDPSKEVIVACCNAFAKYTYSELA